MPGFPRLSCECTTDSFFCLSIAGGRGGECMMQLRSNYAALFGHPEQFSPLLDKHLTALRAVRQIWQQWKMIREHCLLLQWNDDSAKTRKRDSWMSVKELCTRVRIKFLYSKLQASLSCSEGQPLFTLLNFCPSWATVPHPVALATAPYCSTVQSSKCSDGPSQSGPRGALGPS